MTAARGLIVAAPASGSGKTTVTLGLLGALRRAGVAAAPAKAGPDYIDPTWLAAAAGRPCRNLDPWAMRAETLGSIVGRLASGAELVLCEGVMGLFDGAVAGGRADAGSTADLAAATGWPVVLVLDVAGQGATAAAVARGLVAHRHDVAVAGVILNRVGGPGHRAALALAFAGGHGGAPLLGMVPRDGRLRLPSRHLGLVTAAEHAGAGTVLEQAAATVGAAVDTAALAGLAAPAALPAAGTAPGLPPPGQRIAVARDAAFGFAYDAALEDWRGAGAELIPFSPLRDEAPSDDADAVFLPGGYPELHGGRLAAAGRFRAGLRAAAARGAAIYGECGGYMALGDGLVDGDGRRHRMAGLLPLESSFAERRLRLGYRQARLAGDGVLGAAGTLFRGHEFHYARADGRAAQPLFRLADAGGRDLGPAGMAVGRIAGSFVHVIDRAR